MQKQKLINYTAYTFSLVFVIIVLNNCTTALSNLLQKHTALAYGSYPVLGYEAKLPETELNIKDYVKQEVEKAGLSWEEANCIITEESQWRDDICIIEPDMSISCGIWQLNTVHNKNGLTNACKVNYKCATEFAIKKRLHDGNWSAWTQWNNKCK